MRALVSIFAALLILISLYQLSFTWFVNGFEKEQQQKAEAHIKRVYPSAIKKYPGNKDAQAAYQDTLDNLTKDYTDSLLRESKDKVITWWGQSYQKAKERELLLGLDLQGGINVTLDVALDGLIKGLANDPKDPNLARALADANNKKLNSDQNYIDLFAQSWHELYPNTRLATQFINPKNTGKLNLNASDADVVTYIRSQADAAMKQTYQVLRNRIDKFGVAQPNINPDYNKNIITIELAGAKDPERVRKYLQSTAHLQFWEVYTWEDVGQNMITANKNLADYLNNSKADTSKKDTSVANSMPLFKVLAPAQGQQDPQTQRVSYEPYIGHALLKDTDKVNQYFNLPVVKSAFPANTKFLWSKQARDKNDQLVNYLDLYAIKTVPGREAAKLEGGEIEHADQGFDPITNQVTVNMSMTASGAKIWSDMTDIAARQNHKPIAIVLDDIVYSAPRVDEKIDGGNSRITMGGGDRNDRTVIDEAQDLANILESGKLDAPAKIVQEQVIGPTLGAAAVKGGMLAFGISFVVIFLLMLVYYNTAGIVADVALILNLLFTVGVLSALNATLTAPGIAALVLTVGMAVDTNVIIFERIKEELAGGNTYVAAVKQGYRRSLPPVLDAHITTLLTAIILFIYGFGPILGFATTQILGILLSLFCGILVSRLFTDFYTNKNRHFTYFTTLSRKIFRHANFHFIQFRKVAYVISAFVLILGVGAFFNGFKEGVEFSGGRSYVVKFMKPTNTTQVADALKKTFGSFPVVKIYGANDQLDITTDYMINDAGPTVDSTVRKTLYGGLKPFLPSGLSYEQFNTSKYILSTSKVLPTISDDLKRGAQWATLWSMVIITIYIFLRFRDWRYSVGTLLSLLHDVLVTLAVFSYFKNIVPFPLEIDQNFIAAVLTVIGFSMNDTVIVYDRIREYSRNMRNADKTTIINKAINDTLSRTIMTSLTVFLTILILFLVGGEVTRGFAFAMLIGVVTGTYSSIFVAAPILVDFAKNRPLGEADLASHEEKAKKKPLLAKKA